MLVPSVVMDILLFDRYTAANSLAYALVSQAKDAPSVRDCLWQQFLAHLPPEKPVADMLEDLMLSGYFFSARLQEVTDAVLTAWQQQEFEAKISTDWYEFTSPE